MKTEKVIQKAKLSAYIQKNGDILSCKRYENQNCIKIDLNHIVKVMSVPNGEYSIEIKITKE